MFNVMQKLISKKFYPTTEDAQDKIDIFFATNRLTDEQYVELTELVVASYASAEVTA